MSGKLALKYMGKNAEAMKSIAQASKDRSLADFKKVCNFALPSEDVWSKLLLYWILYSRYSDSQFSWAIIVLWERII